LEQVSRERPLLLAWSTMMKSALGQICSRIFGKRDGNVRSMPLGVYLLLFCTIITIFCGVYVTGVEISLIGSGDERTCDTAYGKQGNVQCQYAHLRLLHDDSTNLLANLEELDNNNLVRRIYLNVHMHDAESSTLAVDTQLDMFLTPRPFWLVMSEETMERPTEEHKHVYHIYLLKYTQRLEAGLKLIASVQYPPTVADCAATPLEVDRFLNKGWGSQMMLLEGEWEGNVDKIFNIWDSVANDPQEVTPYLSKDMCPDVINKHECAYLSLTNCTMPSVLTSAQGQASLSKALNGDNVRFNSASAEGVRFDSSKHSWSGPPRVQELVRKFRDQFAGDYHLQQSDKFIEARGHHISRPSGITRPDANHVLPALGFMFRERAPYRRLIHAAVSKFRRKYDFPISYGDHENCVSIHIRRGDRVTNNIKEFCSRYRHFEENGTCINIVNPADYCGISVSDYGCFSEHPYASLALTDYLERAATLTNTPIVPGSNASMTVFIMTDDGKWLTDEVARLGAFTNILHNTSTSGTNDSPFKNWRILAVPARFDGHSGHVQQHLNHETDSGVEFLASIQLLRTCPNFVGHFGSGLTVGLAHTLCFQHGASTTGKCPNTYDIGYAYGDDGHQLWLPPMNIPRSHG
jgi:hypothetical protein